MESFSPKINLLYYKNILDNVFKDFFNDNNDYFRNENGLYVFSKSITSATIKKYFTEHIVAEIKKYITPYSVINPNYYFIIGSCNPSKNILLKYRVTRPTEYFPEKLDNLLKSEECVKYVLKEKDIRIDIHLFNDVFETIFNEFFNVKNIVKKIGYKNIFFIKNESLDCYLLFKVIKNIFGNSNVINLHKKFKLANNICIYSINELIDKYIHGKVSLVNSDYLKIEKKEIEQYILNCFKFCK